MPSTNSMWKSESCLSGLDSADMGHEMTARISILVSSSQPLLPAKAPEYEPVCS